jgi:hypothetical protein
MLCYAYPAHYEPSKAALSCSPLVDLAIYTYAFSLSS